MALIDTLEALIGDIDAAIAREKVDSDTRLAVLRARKAVLRDAQQVLTPTIEKVFVALRAAGVI